MFAWMRDASLNPYCGWLDHKKKEVQGGASAPVFCCTLLWISPMASLPGTDTYVKAPQNQKYPERGSA